MYNFDDYLSAPINISLYISVRILRSLRSFGLQGLLEVGAFWRHIILEGSTFRGGKLEFSLFRGTLFWREALLGGGNWSFRFLGYFILEGSTFRGSKNWSFRFLGVHYFGGKHFLGK